MSLVFEPIAVSLGKLVSVCFDLAEPEICHSVLQTRGRYNVWWRTLTLYTLLVPETHYSLKAHLVTGLQRPSHRFFSFVSPATFKNPQVGATGAAGTTGACAARRATPACSTASGCAKGQERRATPARAPGRRSGPATRRSAPVSDSALCFRRALSKLPAHFHRFCIRID